MNYLKIESNCTTALLRAGALVCIFVFAQGACAQDAAAKIDEYMNAAVKADNFAGAILVARDGKVIASKGYSFANFETETPNTPQTKFRIGSMTKPLTATAILMLQEKGKLNVEDSICKYLSDCPAAWQPVTVRHLLTHTSGIPDYIRSSDATQATFMLPLASSAVVALFKDKPLEFAPGERWKYSNSAYFLAGLIVEKVSGKSYEAFMRENIFEPLRLTNTGIDRNERVLKNRASGYSLENNTLKNAVYYDISNAYSTGAIYSTVEDLYQWNQSLFAGQLVSKKTLDEMLIPVKSNFGVGWFIDRQLNRQFIWHDGSLPGFKSYIARYANEQLCVVVLSNIDTEGLHKKIGASLAAIVLGEKYDVSTARAIASVNPSIYDAYVGQYQIAPNFILTMTKEDNRLMMQATGQSRAQLFPETETMFFLRVVDAQVTFVRDNKGQVTGLVLRQKGREIQANKIK